MPTVEVLEDGVAVFHGKDKLNFYLYFLIIIPSKGRVTLIDLRAKAAYLPSSPQVALCIFFAMAFFEQQRYGSLKIWRPLRRPSTQTGSDRPWAEARHYVHSVVIWTVPTVEVLEDGVAVFHGKVLLFVDSNLLTRNYVRRYLVRRYLRIYL